jgi:hypothetical protein
MYEMNTLTDDDDNIMLAADTATVLNKEEELVKRINGYFGKGQ